MNPREGRITPYDIRVLRTGEVFVFGSNEAGKHGKGAAKTARKWGAIYGQGVGLQGQTYGIPTKNRQIKTLPIPAIAIYVKQFIEFAKENKELKFLVVEIGCMLAGYNPEDIAPLFIDAINIPNICLPERFWDVIAPMKEKSAKQKPLF